MPHIPVMQEEVLHYLAPHSDRCYVDGTLGRAGHALAILERASPSGRLVAIDRDPDALAAARERLSAHLPRVTLVHDTFGNIAEILAGLGLDRVDGFLLDLGVSSPQLDQAERGFSFTRDGPLDMRMDPTGGETALELLRRIDPVELAQILRELGEERFSKRIAAVLKERVRAGDLETTAQLAAVVTDAIPRKAQRHMNIHPATRTFQALRIAVNRELEELDSFLAAFPPLLATGGRCAIISFHSLEDRRVKQTFRELEKVSGLPPDLAARAGERSEPVCRRVTRKPIYPSEQEVARNPRARSARLRVCEKVGSE